MFTSWLFKVFVVWAGAARFEHVAGNSCLEPAQDVIARRKEPESVVNTVLRFPYPENPILLN